MEYRKNNTKKRIKIDKKNKKKNLKTLKNHTVNRYKYKMKRIYGGTVEEPSRFSKIRNSVGNSAKNGTNFIIKKVNKQFNSPVKESYHKMGGLSKIGREKMSSNEKETVIKSLDLLKNENKISKDAYNYALLRLNESGNSLGITDSIVSIMSPIQGVVKVIGDWLIPVDINKMHGRQTIVKVLQFPKASKSFVKESLGKHGKDVDLDENLVLIKDFFPTPSERFAYDLNLVDNYLANVINGCIGPGCSRGITNITPKLANEINITNNTSMKDLLRNIKEKEEFDSLQ